MLSRRSLLIGAGAVGAGAAAGGLVWALPGEEQETGRPDVRLGRDVCDWCGMVIADGRFAAAARLPDGTPWRFDDLGCLLNKLLKADSAVSGVDAWVASYLDERWLEADAAWYVASSNLATPMAYGVIAVATRAEAEVQSEAVGGTVLRWGDLVERWVPGEGLGSRAGAADLAEWRWFA